MKVKITARSGDSFEVNASDSACLSLGPFKHGDVVTHINGWEARVLGVARDTEWANYGRDVLWMNDVEKDRVGAFFYRPAKLGEFSLKRKKMPEIWQRPGFSSVPISKPSIEITFKPLKGGRVRCNQTNMVMKASRANGYRRQMAAGAI